MRKKLSYTSAMEELQMIITEIQSESVGMDDLSEKVKRGAELIQFCKEKLRNTEEELKDVLG